MEIEKDILGRLGLELDFEGRGGEERVFLIRGELKEVFKLGISTQQDVRLRTG